MADRQPLAKGDDFVMMDISHEYTLIDQEDSLSDEAKMQKKLAIQEEDAKRKERAHNLRQLLRAHLVNGKRCRLYHPRRQNCHH